MSTHYATLDVTPGADEHALRAAYHRAALATHPDKGGDAAAFQRVADAYATLTDPISRVLYDASLRAPADVWAGAGAHDSAGAPDVAGARARLAASAERVEPDVAFTQAMFRELFSSSAGGAGAGAGVSGGAGAFPGFAAPSLGLSAGAPSHRPPLPSVLQSAYYPRTHTSQSHGDNPRAPASQSFGDYPRAPDGSAGAPPPHRAAAAPHAFLGGAPW